MMHDHDDLLIAALAGGELPADEARAARTTISGCSRCSTELELQVAMRAQLRGMAAPGLSDFERTRLHGALDRATERRGRPWYVWAAPALATAAALTLVVGIGLATLRPPTGVEQSAVGTDAPADRQLEDSTPPTEAESLMAPGAPTAEDFGELTRTQLDTVLQEVAASEQPRAALGEVSASPFECDAVAAAEEGARVGSALVEGRSVDIYKLGEEGAAAFEVPGCALTARFPAD